MTSRRKRTLFITVPIIVLVLVAGAFLVPRAFAASCFTDTSGHWAESFICWLFDNGISSGFPDGSYRPDNNTTRGEMAVFLQNTAGLVRADFFNGGSQVVTSTTGVTIAGLSMTTTGNCILLMNGTVDWDDDNTTAIFRMEWQVDGTQVGRDFADQDEGATFSNDSFTAIAGTVLAPGTHSVNLVGRVNTGQAAGIENVGAYALCVPFDGSGSPAGPASGSAGSDGGVVDPADPTQG